MSSKTHYWKAFDRRRGRFQVWGRRRFQLALMKQYMAWNTRFRDAQTTGELLGTFDMPQGPISESFNEVYVRVGQAFAKEQGDEFKSTHGYRVKDAPTASVSRDYIEAWVARECGERIVGITATTQRLMQSIVKRSVDEGLSIDRTQAFIRTEFAAMSRVRAERIARTEIVSASNMGSQLAAESTGLTLVKEWLATRDGRTREDHAEADGQTVPLNEMFIVGGEAMMQPGDPSASGANTINCRCVAVYREDKGATSSPFELPAPPEPPLQPLTGAMGEAEYVKRYERLVKETTAELGLNEPVMVNFQALPDNMGGYVKMIRMPDGRYISDPMSVTINTKFADDSIRKTIRHELRHIQQGVTGRHYQDATGLYWDGNRVMMIPFYNATVRNVRMGSQDALKRYRALPWEVDARKFAGQDI